MENDEQNYYYLAEGENIDIRRYFSLFVSNWYWFAAALFISIAIAYGVNRYGEEIYTSESILLIKDEQYGGGYAELDKIIPGGDIFRARQNLQNEIGILRSFDLNHQVMYKLPDFHVIYMAVGRRGIAESNQYRTSPYIVKYDTLARQPMGKRVDIRILSPETYSLIIESDGYEGEHRFGERFAGYGFDFTIVPRSVNSQIYFEGKSNKYYFMFVSPAYLANVYRSRLAISPIEEEATLVSISISGQSSQQSADYLNMLMETYLDQGLLWKSQAASQTIEFIDSQLGIVSDSLLKAESAMENFRFDNRFIDLTTEGTLVLQKLERYEMEKTGINLQLQYYNYLKNYLTSRDASGSIISPSIMGVNDPALINLVEDLSGMQKQQQQLDFVLRDDVPAVSLISEKLAQTRQNLEENVNNGIIQLTMSLNDVNRRIDQVDNELGRLPGTERRLIRIQRDFDLNNTVYNFLLEKRAEAGIAMASKVSDNRVIDRAEPSNSIMVKPKTRQNYMLAFLLGFIIPAVAIVIIDLLNNKVIDKKDIERITRAPILGFISHSKYSTETPVIEKPSSTLAESFRSIRASLRYFVPADQSAVISVTSTVSGEGKTFVAVNLASVISLLGKKTLLVGLDLRKPRIHRILGIDNSEGMSTYLSSNNSFDEIVKQTSIENLWYAPAGPVPPNPAELIERSRMEDFIVEARKKFDYIIFDTPPIAIVTDALLLGQLSDMMLFVVRQRYSSRTTLNLVDEIYRNKEIKNPGILVNDISTSGYYGYGLRYGYAPGYTYGYNYGYKYYGYTSYGKESKATGEYYTND